MATASIEDVIERNADIIERVRSFTQGFVITDSRGVALETTFDNSTASSMYKLLVGHFASLTRSAIRDINPTDDLTFLRIKTKKNEYLIAPEKEFSIIVVQSS